MAELISQERFEIWDQFIERWPIEKLWAITVGKDLVSKSCHPRKNSTFFRAYWLGVRVFSFFLEPPWVFLRFFIDKSECLLYCT